MLRSVLAFEATVLVLLLAACGGDGADDAGLSEEAEAGRRLVLTSGCASCHSENGEGGIGPKFVGLHGSEVELSDGSTVVADDAYLSRSITDPGAQRVDGFAINMPTNALSDDEVAQVVTWIRELGTEEPGS